EGIWIRDLNSRAGTHINGIWLRALNPVAVKANDRIWLGGVELTVVSSFTLVEGGCDFTGSDEDTGSWNSQFEDRTLLDDLTPAELAIVYCLGRGIILDAEIGQELKRSPHTVRTQFASIYQKIGVHSRGELLGWLKRFGGAT